MKATPEQSEELEGRADLDPFGHDDQSQRVSELNSAPNQLHTPLIAMGSQVGEEGTVELELGDREAAEIRKRGKPCAEVVDRHPETECTEFFDELFACLEVADDRGLRDLEYHG